MLLTFQRTADYSVYNNARHTERSGCLSILECSICHLFNFKTVLTILGHRHSDMHFTLCQITNTPTHAKILIWVALNLLHCLQNNNNIYKGTKKRVVHRTHKDLHINKKKKTTQDKTRGEDMSTKTCKRKPE